MSYTKEQKEKMFQKIKAMKDGTIVNLNKDDVCPIKCVCLRKTTTECGLKRLKPDL